MRWDEMTPREKTERIVQDVMRWTYFPTWDLAHTAKWALEHDEPIIYPYAFWNDQTEGISVFYRDYADARPFNPLESMDAAWQIVEKLMSSEIFYLQTRSSDAGRFYTAELYGGHSHCSHTSALSMPDAICVAALCACGVTF